MDGQYQNVAFICTKTDDIEVSEILRDHEDVVRQKPGRWERIQLLTENAPIWAALFAGLAVNLRMAMYSAALVPHLGAAPLWQRARSFHR